MRNRHSDSFTSEKEFEVEFNGRIFFGTTELEWDYEPGENGDGWNEPRYEGYYYVSNVNILDMNWSTFGEHEHKVVKGDRNWLRLNKTLVHLEEILKQEWSDLRPDADNDFREPIEREPSNYEISQAETKYERSIAHE